MMTSEVTENVPLGTAPVESAPAGAATAAALTAVRLEKVREHLRQSLGKADSLEANLGAVAADLMLMACRLTEAIEQALDKRSLADFEKLVPAIDAYLRVARQIDRLASLDRRLASSRAPAA